MSGTISFWAVTTNPNGVISRFTLPHGTLPEAPSDSLTFSSGNPYGQAVAGAYDYTGNLFFLMSGIPGDAFANAGAILKITPAGVQSFLATAGPMYTAFPSSSIAIDMNGNIYGCDNSNDVVYYSSTGAGPTTLCNSARYFSSGAALTLDVHGNLIAAVFDANTGNFALLKISLPAGTITVLNPNIISVPAAAGASVANSMCCDETGSLYVLWSSVTAFGVAQFSASGTEINDSFISGNLAIVFTMAYDPSAQQFYICSSANSTYGFIVVYDKTGTVIPTKAFQLGYKSGPYTIAATNDKLKIAVDGAAAVTITLTSGAARTAAQVAADINAALGSAIASVSSGAVLFESLTTGASSQINLESIFPNAAYGTLGIQPGGATFAGSINSVPIGVNLSAPFISLPSAVAGPPVPPAIATGQPFTGTFVGFFGAGNVGGGQK